MSSSEKYQPLQLDFFWLESKWPSLSLSKQVQHQVYVTCLRTGTFKIRPNGSRNGSTKKKKKKKIEVNSQHILKWCFFSLLSQNADDIQPVSAKSILLLRRILLDCIVLDPDLRSWWVQIPLGPSLIINSLFAVMWLWWRVKWPGSEEQLRQMEESPYFPYLRYYYKTKIYRQKCWILTVGAQSANLTRKTDVCAL